MIVMEGAVSRQLSALSGTKVKTKRRRQLANALEFGSDSKLDFPDG
jgi:hypothetical protein